MTHEINNRTEIENRVLDNLSNRLDTFEDWEIFKKNNIVFC